MARGERTADQSVVDASDLAETFVVFGTHDHELPGRQRSGDLVGVVEETADPAHERPDWGGVGATHEADRTIDDLAERKRSENRSERQRAGVDHDQGALATWEELVAADSDIPPQARGANHRAHQARVSAPVVDDASECGGHQATCTRAGRWTMLGQLYRRSITSTVP